LIILGDENASKLFLAADKGDFYPFSKLELEELYLGREVVDSHHGYLSLSTLKKITFGKYLKVVGTGVYYNINKIPTTAEIYCENITPPYISNKFTTQQYISNVVYVPQEALEAYKQADGWKNFWDIRAYNPESGVEDVSIENVSAEVFRVYNLAGILVKETADKADICNLPSGIYIINGRKVAIR